MVLGVISTSSGHCPHAKTPNHKTCSGTRVNLTTFPLLQFIHQTSCCVQGNTKPATAHSRLEGHRHPPLQPALLLSAHAHLIRSLLRGHCSRSLCVLRPRFATVWVPHSAEVLLVLSSKVFDRLRPINHRALSPLWANTPLPT